MPFQPVSEKLHELILTVQYHNGEEEIRRQYFSPAQKDAKHKLHLQWITSTGGIIWKSSPLIVGDNIFVGTTDDVQGAHHGVHAIDKKTGTKRWSSATKNSIKHQLRYQNNLLLASDVETNIYALDVQTGKTK